MNIDLFRSLVDGGGKPEQYFGLAVLAACFLAMLWINADRIGGGNKR